MTRNQFIDGMTKVGIATAAGVIVALFSFYLARKAYSADKIQESLDSKLGKIEYKEEVTKHDQEERAYRIQVEKRMDRENQTTNEKLDLIIKLIEK